LLDPLEKGMKVHAGGCLCGALRYETSAEPVRITFCHCRFCQRATGSAFMVEPLFRIEDLHMTKGAPTIYELRSAGSGKMVRIHFCPSCGTKLYLAFERFADCYGVYAGTFDDPNWFETAPENTKQIFMDMARPDTILQAGIASFHEHARLNDGTVVSSEVFDKPVIVGQRGGRGRVT
jgi:hypothetical protein